MYQPFLVVWKKRKELSEGNKVTTSAALEKTEAEKRRYKELLKAHVQKIEVKKLEAKVAVEGEIKAILMEARKEADTFYRDEQAKLQSQIKLERTKVFKMLGQIEQQVMSSSAG
jgi:intein/homing endonuclease